MLPRKTLSVIKNPGSTVNRRRLHKSPAPSTHSFTLDGLPKHFKINRAARNQCCALLCLANNAGKVEDFLLVYSSAKATKGKQAIRANSGMARVTTLSQSKKNKAKGAYCSSSRLTWLFGEGTRLCGAFLHPSQKHGGARGRTLAIQQEYFLALARQMPANQLPPFPLRPPQHVWYCPGARAGRGTAPLPHATATRTSAVPRSGFQHTPLGTRLRKQQINFSYTEYLHKQAQHMRPTCPLPSEIARARHYQYNARPPRRKEHTKKEREEPQVRRKGGADAPGIPERA